jgi:aspartate 1-decarboxylase
MMLKMMKGKLHRATVTQTEPDYSGSLTVDEDLLEAAGMLAHEAVLVADCDNGNRFETYIIKGPRGSGVMCVNGAAALLTGVGHRIIVIAFAYCDAVEAARLRPRVVVLDAENRPTKTEA